MSEYAHRRRDARDCPQCGARGILPLHQDRQDDALPGTIENPVMICPVCDEKFRATGMTWMGAVDVGDMTDAEFHEFAEVLSAQLLEMARWQSRQDPRP